MVLPAPASSLGLIAGSGDFPILVAKSAKEMGMKVVAVGFKSQTDARLAGVVDDLQYIGVGQLGKLIRIFKDAHVRQAIMAGKLQHKLIFRDLRLDLTMIAMVARLKDRRANSLLGGIAEEMHKKGITLIDSTLYVAKDLASEGVMSSHGPSAAEAEDIAFGHKIARELARLDIGQTVAVKDKAVVALEGFEGTDAMIARGGDLAGKGVVIVKVCKPDQDMRFDVPVIGKATLEAMHAAGSRVLAITAGKTLILHREEFLAQAKASRIVVVGLPS